MSNLLKIRRGTKASLPTLAAGEPGFCTDTNELYIGTGAGNVFIGSPSGMTNPMTAAGDMIIGGTAGNPTRLAKGTARQRVQMKADETAPEWGADVDAWGLAASVAANALTVALKGEDGNDPSASNPVSIRFRDETPATGTPNVRTVTGAKSIALSSGSTLGYADETLSYTRTGYNELIGYDAANFAGSQSFTPDRDIYLSSVELYIGKDGSPTGNLTVEIQTSSSGKPSGTVVTDGTSGTLPESGLNADYAYETFAFSTPPLLSAGTEYHIVLKTNRSASTTNFVYWATDAAGAAPPGHCCYANSSYVWTAQTRNSTHKLNFHYADVPMRVYVWAIDNGGTVEMGVSKSAGMFPESKLVTTTAEGGAGGADSATVMYSGTARTSVAVRCLGYVDVPALPALGYWSTTPDKVQIMGPGVERSGEIVQVQASSTATSGSTNALIPWDNTKPQNTEGTELLTVTITPRSASNRLIVEAFIPIVDVGANGGAALALFQDSRADALATAAVVISQGNLAQLHLRHEMYAETENPATFKMRIGTTSTHYVYWLRRNDVVLYDSTPVARMTVTEVEA
jgi:hypothetical protein